MTRDDIIAFGKRKYGKKWIARLAKEIGYSISSIMRMAEGETPVTRRMELEMKELRRREGFAAMLMPSVKVQYE